MKSSDIKNWNYELSYFEITELQDFGETLTEAIVHDSCLICGGNKVNNAGLCFNCRERLRGKDKKAMEKVSEDYEVLITVKKRVE